MNSMEMLHMWHILLKRSYACVMHGRAAERLGLAEKPKPGSQEEEVVFWMLRSGLPAHLKVSHQPNA